jgi:hypothetical protein
MARKNELQVSPAQQTLRGRVESLSQTSKEQRVNTGENVEVLAGCDEVNMWQEGMTVGSSQHPDQHDEDYAEGLAGIINKQSLKKVTEGIRGRAVKAATLNSLARPNTIYEDISKSQKPRSSGRPDPFEVPQSPQTSPAPETRPKVTQRRVPKPKQVTFRGKPKKVARAVAEGPQLVDEAETSPDRARSTTSPTEEQNVTSKRATRGSGEAPTNVCQRNTRPSTALHLWSFRVDFPQGATGGPR